MILAHCIVICVDEKQTTKSQFSKKSLVVMSPKQKSFRISRDLGLFVYISKLSVLLPPLPKLREIMKYWWMVIYETLYGESAFNYYPIGICKNWLFLGVNQADKAWNCQPTFLLRLNLSVHLHFSLLCFHIHWIAYDSDG